MSGVRVIAGVLGVAWLVAGGGAVWQSCASSSARMEAIEEQVAGIEKNYDVELTALEKRLDEAKKAGDDARTEAEANLAEKETALAETSTALREGIDETKAKMAEADLALDTRQVSRLEKALARQERRLAKTLARPTRRRDAAKAALEKTNAATENRVKKLTESIKLAGKTKDTAVEGVRKAGKEVDGSSGFPIKPLAALLLGMALLAVGIVWPFGRAATWSPDSTDDPDDPSKGQSDASKSSADDDPDDDDSDDDDSDDDDSDDDDSDDDASDDDDSDDDDSDDDDSKPAVEPATTARPEAVSLDAQPTDPGLPHPRTRKRRKSIKR